MRRGAIVGTTCLGLARALSSTRRISFESILTVAHKPVKPKDQAIQSPHTSAERPHQALRDMKYMLPDKNITVRLARVLP
ncbi:MAG: hypothetical protein ROR55_14965 [Devosia sp.]